MQTDNLSINHPMTASENPVADQPLSTLNHTDHSPTGSSSPIIKKRLLHIVFENIIEPAELSAFRGAIIHKVGKEHTLFHNHSSGGYIYKYPLIQYKLFKQKHPSLLCIELGVDEIYHFFKNKNWNIDIHGKETELKVMQLNLYDATFRQIVALKKYTIHDWLALNEENYQKYINTIALKDKISLLENILKANILAMAKGIDWHIPNNIELSIENIGKQKMIHYKGVKLIAFTLTFYTNILLPNHISLGKGAAMGFGEIRKIH
ncbi:MAG: hypothetical protein KatS3mg096_846 [Candidatus Parcubacteria bacterium]|nr:MAG: hypothetical protein KatS3mg096_846 [Candidatus Parcubacteria bacterium]